VAAVGTDRARSVVFCTVRHENRQGNCDKGKKWREGDYDEKREARIRKGRLDREKAS
jgi:hypothetical protein